MNENQQSQLKDLITKGKEQGFLTYAQVNDHLPDDIVDPEQIEDIINMINDMGILVYERAPDADSLILNDDAAVTSDDDSAVVLLLDPIQFLHPAEANQMRGSDPPAAKLGHQVGAAGDHARGGAVLIQQIEDIAERPRRMHLEIQRRGHRAPLFSAAMRFAAASTASTILLYPVQRQRLPARALVMASRPGSASLRSRASAFMTMPGVQ